MKRMNTRRIFNMAIAMLILLAVSAAPAMAWGGLTHYSIDRDAGKDSYEELSAANAPDVFWFYGDTTTE